MLGVVAVAVHVAVAELNGRWRRVGDIAIDRTIAVVHRADKRTLATLLGAAAPSALAVAIAVAVAVAEETLLARGLRFGRPLFEHRGRLLILGLGLILALAAGLSRATLVLVPLAATTAATSATASLIMELTLIR
jgi:hypothetical protein